MNRVPPFSQDAATVLGIAGTALPFAASSYEQSERWLRVLRLHGEAGRALQAIGVGEAPLDGAPPIDPERATGHEPGEDVVASVIAAAADIAAQRGETSIGTVDVLYAVMRVYGPSFEQALDRRGTSSGELIERLGDSSKPPAG